MSQKRRRLRAENLENRILLTFDFRSIDGMGNNPIPQRAAWGAAETAMVRLTYPGDYPDGFGDNIYDSPQWPNPRTVSNTINAQDGPIPNARNLSDWIVQWGQFLTHDLDLTENGAEFDEMSTGQVGDYSIPITDPNDPLGPNPITFHRSEYHPNTGDATPLPAPPPMMMRPNWREQMNSVTAFIDASNVYGSDEIRADALRTFADGKLKTSANGLLPDLNGDNLQNDDPLRIGESLFLAGDVRANEQIGLMATHALFVREHNRLAEALATEDPTLNDEEIYQIARKIVGAEMQIITYTEFLPALIGEAGTPDPNDYVYRDFVDPAITNSFAASFFRYGHSMQSTTLELVDNNGVTVDSLRLRDIFFNAARLQNNPSDVDLALKGLATQVSQENDIHLIDDIRNFLFGPPGAGGMDLAALDIQRGRDHGLVDYNEMRRAYRIPAFNSFAQLTSDQQLQADLQDLYGNINSVDSFIGAIAEDHVPGTSVGRMVQRSIQDQFMRLRDGDRYFYTGDPDLQDPLVEAVIDLDNLTLANVIRANTAITNIQDNVFFAANDVAPATVTEVMVNDQMEDPDDLSNGNQPTSWQQQRSDIRTVMLHFSEDLGNVMPQHVRLTNLGVNAPQDPDTMVPLNANQIDVNGDRLEVSFDAAELEDGVYRLEIMQDIPFASGNQLDGNADGQAGDRFVYAGNEDNQFYVLRSDFNGDRGVSIFDLQTLTYWFGRLVPQAPEYVDGNGDGGISVFDFPFLADNFGEAVVFMPPPPPAARAAVEELSPTSGEELLNARVLERVQLDIDQTSPVRRLDVLEVREASERDNSLDALLEELAMDVANA